MEAGIIFDTYFLQEYNVVNSLVNTDYCEFGNAQNGNVILNNPHYLHRIHSHCQFTLTTGERFPLGDSDALYFSLATYKNNQVVSLPYTPFLLSGWRFHQDDYYFENLIVDELRFVDSLSDNGIKVAGLSPANTILTIEVSIKLTLQQIFQ